MDELLLHLREEHNGGVVNEQALGAFSVTWEKLKNGGGKVEGAELPIVAIFVCQFIRIF